MQLPVLTDTIVAVSSGWQPAALGIVRLSGPQALALLGELGIVRAGPTTSSQPQWTAARLPAEPVGPLPATVFWFQAPRSYTGQDVVEFHTVGSLPVLRELSAWFIARGARRALPGEFTARAYLNGRLDAGQVEDVLALMHGQQSAAARQAARRARATEQYVLTQTAARLTDLLALIEAGIDFVDEDDVRFVTPAEIVAHIDALLGGLAGLAARGQDERRAGQPHVALVGLANAGKSTLFNALLGVERALVSPVLGTTRDVLSAEIEIGGHALVLQDCAGLGDSADELELATHLATERAAEQADVVLWVHAANTDWTAREVQACTRIAGPQRVLVLSKADLAGGSSAGQAAVAGAAAPPTDFAGTVVVSVLRAAGLAELRDVLAARVGARPAAAPDDAARDSIARLMASLRAARAVAVERPESSELVSLELRTAQAWLEDRLRVPLDEEVLGRIFARFCVGK